ncbi:OLC1v1021743C1 [Oldenlandia corymbosa var. corymbosa]|uniref:OLC1v1021743C1 n=1 Tax=Oldenlandia corymbosa var. corymbosa TaxID=529605 RepID=A0AAV1BWA6_OLDCO|nr:OLC1v1021743C1 [Oldenlandia corymbosa var. corymbosa]
MGKEIISVEQATVLISSLISVSHSIRVFAVKWQIIRERLEELLSSLTVIENCDSIENNPSFLATLSAILASLKDCEDLAKRCLGVSYSGKLLMQSDLDIVCATLRKHNKSLSDIYNLGLLTQSNAIVLSRPNLGASKDDMKIYVKDLFSRLKIGCPDMKRQALISFNEVSQDDDRYVKVALELESFVLFLVNFLDSQEHEIQEEAAKAVSVIAGFEVYRGVLISAGIIAPLIRILESGTELSKGFAANSLQKLTENSENAWSISAHGGVTALLKLCSSTGDCPAGLVALACGVLKNLVGVEEIKKFMVEEGAIPALIKLIRSKDGAIASSQISAIDFLQTMASGDESIKAMIVKEGGVRALVRVLDPKLSSSSKAKEIALKGIMNLCIPSANSFGLLHNYGFLDHILYFLHYGENSVQELALKATFWLSETSDEAKKAMGDAGFMPEVVKFLDSKSLEVCEVAAETLYSLFLVPRNRKRFVQSDQNVGCFLQTLDQMEMINNYSGNKKLLLSILMSLTNFNSARRKIANSGYLKKIEKLAVESDNSDAKKIVRRLSSNRFRSILNGIWHS